MTPAQINTLRDMRAQGMATKAIAAHFGKSENAIEWQIKKHNLPPKPRVDLSEQNRIIAEMRKAGASMIQIGAALGLAPNTVGGRLDKMGLRKPRPRAAPVAKAPPPPPPPPVTLEDEVRAAGRNYSALADIAARHNMTLRGVQCLAHRARG